MNDPAPYVELGGIQLTLAALLILCNGAISLLLKLGMERQLMWASLRTIGQLLLIGMILNWVFASHRWHLVLLWVVVMTLVAGATAVGRNRRRFPGIWLNNIISLWAATWFVTAIGLVIVTHGQHPWYSAQYVIPLAGMVFGNTLNGVTLGLNQLTDTLIQRRGEVEATLALGGTRWEAARGAVRQAVRTGMTPIINAMMIVGIVSLPGMMTGQLLAGAPPMQAVKYQIVIMFMIASAVALSTVGVILLSVLRLFSAEHQFRWERLTKVSQ